MRRPVADGLFTVPEDHSQARLIGSRCSGCGAVDFPASARCLACGRDDAERTLLSPTGTLWTWTTQEFRPPSPPYDRADTPSSFVPFGVGYVELPDGIRIESRLTECDPRALTIGAPMRLTLVPFRTDDDGNDVVTFAFAPVGAPS